MPNTSFKKNWTGQEENPPYTVRLHRRHSIPGMYTYRDGWVRDLTSNASPASAA